MDRFSANKKRIFLAVTGTTPQIITETLFALLMRPEGAWIPDEIHVITTSTGRDAMCNGLFPTGKDKFGQFCAEYLEGHCIAFGPECITVPQDPSGNELKDIQDQDSSALFANAIVEKVRLLTRSSDTEIHASIAGGRKSMGFLLGSVMSVYGRSDDCLSHVLVNAPFENHPDFYFPPKQPEKLVLKDRSGNITGHAETGDAHIQLYDIPFVPMRTLLPASKQNALLDFVDLVGIIRGSVLPSVEVDLENTKLICGGQEVEGLEPQEITFYACVCWEILAGKEGLTITDKPTSDFVELSIPTTDHLDLYWSAKVRPGKGRVGDLDEDLEKKITNHLWLPEDISQLRSRIKGKLDKALSMVAANFYYLYMEPVKGQERKTRLIRHQVPMASIKITGKRTQPKRPK